MTEQIQTGPVEVISLAEFLTRQEQGQPIAPGTLLLLPVRFWQQYEQSWQMYREGVEQIFAGLRTEQEGQQS